MPLLEIRKVIYRVKEKEIFSELSLSVDPGEVHAILGRNGTGKSTLAYLIMGCDGYIPTKGEILFDGKAINGLKLHERAKLGITLSWQEPVRFEGISVRDYLTLHNREIDPSIYLEMSGLHPESYINRIMDRTLSGGERKRIELASIVALFPRFAILDEPDSGIDMLSIKDILKIIYELKKHGSSVLLITHREEIANIADRASEICNGKIICTGVPEEVTRYYKSNRCSICAGKECALV